MLAQARCCPAPCTAPGAPDPGAVRCVPRRPIGQLRARILRSRDAVGQQMSRRFRDSSADGAQALCSQCAIVVQPGVPPACSRGQRGVIHNAAGPGPVRGLGADCLAPCAIIKPPARCAGASRSGPGPSGGELDGYLWTTPARSPRWTCIRDRSWHTVARSSAHNSPCGPGVCGW